jgi:hypothetical protein
VRQRQMQVEHQHHEGDRGHLPHRQPAQLDPAACSGGRPGSARPGAGAASARAGSCAWRRCRRRSSVSHGLVHPGCAGASGARRG